jgi:hypothetical protein
LKFSNNEVSLLGEQRETARNALPIGTTAPYATSVNRRNKTAHRSATGGFAESDGFAESR